MSVFACMYVCTMYMPDVYRAHKRALDPLALESPIVLSHHVGVGNQTWILSKWSQPVNHFFSPDLYALFIYFDWIVCLFLRTGLLVTLPILELTM